MSRFDFFNIVCNNLEVIILWSNNSFFFLMNCYIYCENFGREIGIIYFIIFKFEMVLVLKVGFLLFFYVC